MAGPAFADTVAPVLRQLYQRLAIVGGLSVLLCLTFLLLLLQTPAANHATISEIAQIFGYVVATIATLWACIRAPSQRYRTAWLWIAAAYLCNVIAEIIYAYNVKVMHNANPFPSLADGFYLSFYPLMVIGLSMFPISSLSGLQRVEAWIDALIIAGAVLGFGWFYLIAPQVLNNTAMDTPLATIISSAYPVGDVLLLFGLMALIIRRGFMSQPWMLFLIAASLVSLVYADSAYQYLSLQGTYTDGTAWIDLFWVVSALSLAAAALVSPILLPRSAVLEASRQTESSIRSEAWSAVWKVGLLALPFLFITGLARFALPSIPVDSAYSVLDIIRLVLFVSFAVRLASVMWRNTYLTGQLTQAFEQMDDQRQLLAQYTTQLEEGIDQFQRVQAQIAQGNFAVRIQGLEHSALYPYGQMMNRMFDRFQHRVEEANNYSYLAESLRHLEVICQRMYQGEIIPEREWGMFVNTPLAQIAAYLRFKSSHTS